MIVVKVMSVEADSFIMRFVIGADRSIPIIALEGLLLGTEILQIYRVPNRHGNLTDGLDQAPHPEVLGISLSAGTLDELGQSETV